MLTSLLRYMIFSVVFWGPLGAVGVQAGPLLGSNGIAQNSLLKKIIEDAYPSGALSVPAAKISEVETTQSQRGSLSLSDYERYQTLMRGALGKWNPSLEPLIALGMFADTPAEQRRYAEQYARQTYEFTERALRFQRAYREAFDRLYPNVSMVEQRLLSSYIHHREQQANWFEQQRQARRQFQEGDRLLAFVSMDCQQCSVLIGRLMGLVSTVDDSGVDLYVRQAHDDTTVRRWAEAHPLQASWLDQQRLTLNRDEGLHQRLAQRTEQPLSVDIPVYLKRNGQFYQLNPKELGL